MTNDFQESANSESIFTHLQSLPCDEQDFSKDKIYCFKTIDSTNLYAKKLLSENDINQLDKTLILAETQTAGRGRLNRNFYSPAKTGIYLSIIYSPEKQVVNPAEITAYSAVAVVRAIKNIFNVDVKIKWINDLYHNNKKIGGILTEGFINYKTNTIDAVIIGIGINISTQNMPEDISNKAGSILADKNENFSINKFGAEIYYQVLKILKENPEEIIDEYKKSLFTIGQKITVHPIIDDEKTSYEATAIDIDKNANLIVQLEDKSIKVLNSGEVSLHI